MGQLKSEKAGLEGYKWDSVEIGSKMYNLKLQALDCSSWHRETFGIWSPSIINLKHMKKWNSSGLIFFPNIEPLGQHEQDNESPQSPEFYLHGFQVNVSPIA